MNYLKNVERNVYNISEFLQIFIKIQAGKMQKYNIIEDVFDKLRIQSMPHKSFFRHFHPHLILI